MLFDFTNLAGETLVLCVRKNGTNTYLTFPNVVIEITQEFPPQLAGDPHVRSANGQWLDFHGEAGAYTLLANVGVEVNAKLGYAIREDAMLWHPKVQRPGTVVEEVGLRLLASGATVRLAVYGGGVISIREALKPTQFLTAGQDATVQLDGYTLTWGACQDNCESKLPWGTHVRSHTLSVSGNGEHMTFHVAQSGGYRFIDVSASTPATSSTGLLAEAAFSPLLVGRALSEGGRKYQVKGQDFLVSA